MRPSATVALAPNLNPAYEQSMDKTLVSDPILNRFRAAVNDAYGERIARVVLYGSRARGDAQPDSDYDIAVFLRDMPDRISELYRLADLSAEVLDETGAFVHAMAYSADAYDDPRMPLMHEIRREGVDL